MRRRLRAALELEPVDLALIASVISYALEVRALIGTRRANRARLTGVTDVSVTAPSQPSHPSPDYAAEAAALAEPGPFAGDELHAAAEPYDGRGGYT